MDTQKEVALLDLIVRNLVEFPDDIKITRTTDEMGVLLTLDINQVDMGRVIGRLGNTAKAIRTLLRAVGMATGARINLKISDPHPEKRKRSDAQDVYDDTVADLKG